VYWFAEKRPAAALDGSDVQVSEIGQGGQVALRFQAHTGGNHEGRHCG
jgi:hypothetical protein